MAIPTGIVTDTALQAELDWWQGYRRFLRASGRKFLASYQLLLALVARDGAAGLVIQRHNLEQVLDNTRASIERCNDELAMLADPELYPTRAAGVGR